MRWDDYGKGDCIVKEKLTIEDCRDGRAKVSCFSHLALDRAVIVDAFHRRANILRLVHDLSGTSNGGGGAALHNSQGSRTVLVTLSSD